jgi:hypothetical protein
LVFGVVVELLFEGQPARNSPADKPRIKTICDQINLRMGRLLIRNFPDDLL